MKFSTITLLPIVATACPGSPARMHAKCNMDVTFSNSCDLVIAEINARVASTTWVDPHNGGEYTITSSNSTFLSGQRVTGDKKYTDKFDFMFTSTSSGCTVEACSESQVNSLLDYSTNYCNLHDLYCSSSDGCPTAGTELKYSESYTSCSQHDDVCVVAKTRIAVKDESACRTDISEATQDLAQASAYIALAVKDCADGFTLACDSDIDNILAELTSASQHITDAVYDCSGETPTECSQDINDIIADITTATAAITDAVISCQVSATQCAKDIGDAAAAITKLGFDIADAVEDC